MSSNESSETSQNLSWQLKKQRPNKVPGNQNVSELPRLAQTQTSCPEGESCFYFTCNKCSSLLALDTLNPGYRRSLQCIPRIACISRPKPFQENNKYHGEIAQIYLKFLAQFQPSLKGVAINGWSGKTAKKIFKNVQQTFKFTEFADSQNFEIDWILFSGYNVTVIEVKESSSLSKTESCYLGKKIKQIKRNRIVMQHLLEATNSQNTRLNYVIACPNRSFSAMKKSFYSEYNQQELLQDMM